MKHELSKKNVPNSLNIVSGDIVDAALKVHKQLGPGLLESAYEICLKYELKKRGRDVKSQVEIPIVYDGLEIDAGYRLDLLVENSVIVEIKSVSIINRVHEAQLLSYLKLGGYKLGLLINFNVLRIKDGIKRMVNKI